MKNRKSNLILYIIITIVVCIGAFLVYKLAFEKTEESKLVYVTINELETKINNKENFVLVISQTGCSHCEQYLPELDRALKEVNLNAYVINISNLSKEESSTLSKYVNFSGTPTTVFLSEGIEKQTLNRIVGYASKVRIKEKLQKMGYID